MGRSKCIYSFLTFCLHVSSKSNALALSYCRGWIHGPGIRKPNFVLGVLCRQNFPGWVTLPGEGQVRQLGLSWELYLAALAPPQERIDGVLCRTRAEMVIQTFWVISPLQN